MPTVSILMPVHNNESTLRSALRSVLWQTFVDWELILIDDGSTDDTLRLAQQFCDRRIQVHADGKRRGLPARLNEAIGLSRGSFIARMDGDDICYPHRLQRQLEYLNQNPQVDLVGTWVIVFGVAGRPIGKRSGPETHDEICARPFAGFPIVHPTFLGRSSWFRAHSYEERAMRSQDQGLLLRAHKHSRYANVPQVLLGYREARVSLRKSLTGRWYFAQTVGQELLRQQRPGLAMRAVIEQALKGVVDCLAVASGLNHRLVRHRALPASETERYEWERIYHLIGGAG